MSRPRSRRDLDELSAIRELFPLCDRCGGTLAHTPLRAMLKVPGKWRAVHLGECPHPRTQERRPWIVDVITQAHP